MLDMASLTPEQKQQVKAAAKAAKDKAIKRQIEQIKGVHGTRKDGKNRFQPPCSYEDYMNFLNSLDDYKGLSKKTIRIGCGFDTNFEMKNGALWSCAPL